jgi:RsiW-degrading membrane proteinase PrsW (M82 family)
LVLGPLIIIVVEILSLLTTFAMAVIFVSTQSSLVSQMSDLAARLTPLRDSPEALVRVLGPYMAQPAVVLVALFFGAVIIPLIEELIKPIGVWLIARQDLTPAAGFAAGALSGAGYALFESLALGSSGGDSWAALVVARMGTGVIHILNTSLMGWALASAWSQRRYLRLGVTYLITAMIHGIWNGMTILNVYAELLTRVTQMAAQDQPGALTLLAVRVGNAAPAVLGLLTFGGVVLLLSCNRSLRDHSQL